MVRTLRETLGDDYDIMLDCWQSFDPVYAKYGPGQLLKEDVLKWAFERGLDCDFRLGDQAYKRSWANSTSQAITFHFVNSLRGAAFAKAGEVYAGALQWLAR